MKSGLPTSRRCCVWPPSSSGYNLHTRPSTGTKDPEASDILYVKSLAAPHTVNTMPEATLLAFANHGELTALLTADDNAEEVLARFERGGFDVETIAVDLQREGAKAFVDSWNELMAGLAAKGETLKKVS